MGVIWVLSISLTTTLMPCATSPLCPARAILSTPAPRVPLLFRPPSFLWFNNRLLSGLPALLPSVYSIYSQNELAEKQNRIMSLLCLKSLRSDLCSPGWNSNPNLSTQCPSCWCPRPPLQLLFLPLPLLPNIKLPVAPRTQHAFSYLQPLCIAIPHSGTIFHLPPG